MRAVRRCCGVPHLPCGQWKMNGSALRVWQAVPWSSVCPELWEAGGAPAPGDVGSPRILTDLNLLLLFMALCCFSVPQLSSVIFQPQATSAAQPAVHSAGHPSAAVLLCGAPHLLPSARGLFRALWALRA